MQSLAESGCVPNTVAGSVVEALASSGVTTFFYVSGAPLMPFLRTCKTARKLRLVSCRHETSAAIMAAAYFHETRTPAGLGLTSGPGAANAVNGVLHALREQAALFVLSARPASHKIGRGAVQDLDTAALFRFATKLSEQLLHAGQTAFLLEKLLGWALAPPSGPVNLTVAVDQWDLPCAEEER